MAETAPGCTLGDLLSNDRLGLTLLSERPEVGARVVRGAKLVHGKEPGEIPEDVVLVASTSAADGVEGVDQLRALVALPGSRIIVVWGVPGDIDLLATTHVVLSLATDADPADLIAEIAVLAAGASQSPVGKLTSLQRSLTRALAEPNALQALTARTAKVCNAVVTVLSGTGVARYATGPLPLSRFLPELSRTSSDAQVFAVEGWHGLAVRIADSPTADDKNSWFLAASRRASFPDRYSEAAIYIAASLAETSIRLDVAAQRQERAVRSGVLEQVLAMRFERHDAELTGRVASLGISLEQEARVIALELARRTRTQRDATALDALYLRIDRALAAAGIPNLLSLREDAVIGLVQAPAPAIGRAFVKGGSDRSNFLLGIGRYATDVGHVVDSYHDAQLAVRILRRDGASRTSLSYEDFDFATRLFSNVGLDKMGEWADELLRPVEDQPILLDALSAYFDCRQNIMEAADVLTIHHNSLRYRLSKIESALKLNLRDPSAVSSLFLALTAMSMARGESATRVITPAVRSAETGQARGEGAAGVVLSETPGGLSKQFGAAVGPER
jgi:hypothetical protein